MHVATYFANILLNGGQGKWILAVIFVPLNNRDNLIGEVRLGHLPVLIIKELPHIFFKLVAPPPPVCGIAMGLDQALFFQSRQ